MDEATQQNSALVEENAATAKTLEQQSAIMDQRAVVLQCRRSCGRVIRAASRNVAASYAAKAPAATGCDTHQARRATGAGQPRREAGSGLAGILKVSFKDKTRAALRPQGGAFLSAISSVR